MEVAYRVPPCCSSSEDSLRLPGHRVSTPQQLRGLRAFLLPVMLIGYCQCQNHECMRKPKNSFHPPHHHHHQHHQHQHQHHQWVQSKNHHPPTQFPQNRTSCQAVVFFSFFPTPLHLSDSSSSCCSAHQQPCFLTVTSATSSTTLSASSRCLLASLAASCAARLSAAFASDAFLAARSEGVSRTGVLRAGVPRASVPQLASLASRAARLSGAFCF